MWRHNTYSLRKASETMQKKLTITLDEAVYRGLHRCIGRGRIGRFIEDLVRPHVVRSSMEAGYAEMGRDEAREAEAAEWSEGVMGDIADEAR